MRALGGCTPRWHDFIGFYYHRRYHEDLDNVTQALTVRVPLRKPVQVVRSVEHGRLQFSGVRSASPLRAQGVQLG